MIYQKITLLFLLFSLQNSLFSQEIILSGKVSSQINNQPIEFANIFLQDAADQTTQTGTITDRNGQFQLVLKTTGTYQISVSFVGYTNWQKDLIIDKSINLGPIVLQAATNELEEVVVTANKNIITRKEDKLVFNVASSPLKSGYDGLEVLQRSPNVLVSGDGSIQMRGEAPTVMINGRISSLSGEELANYISNLQSDNIQSIEIQTHLSANTDAESSGGLINIILKKKPIGFDASIRSDYAILGDGFNTAFTGATFNYGAQKWNIYGSTNYTFRYRENDIQNRLEYFERQELITAEEVFISKLKRNTSQLGIVGDLGKNHVIGIEGYLSTFNFELNNTSDIDVFNQTNLIQNGQAIVDGIFKGDLYTTTFNYTWTIDTLKSNLKFFADYANQQVSRNNTTTSTYDEGILTDNTERNNSTANTLIYTAQTDLEKYYKNGLKLEAGAKLTYTDRENTLLSDILNNAIWSPTNRTTSFNYTEQVMAAYAAVNKNLGDKYFLEVGLRVENTDLERMDLEDNSVILQNYTNWFPAFYLSRDIGKNKSLSLSYSKRLRRPPFQFLNNNVLKINDFRYELGNPDLIPENVNNYELAVKTPKYSIDFYVRRTTEAINGIYYLDGQISYYQKFNEGIQQQIGISYNRYGNLTKWWNINAIARVFQRKFINELGTDSFERISTRFRFSNNFKLGKTMNLDFSGTYLSKYEDAYYIQDAFYRLDLMLQKSFFDKKVMARIYVNDIFNTMKGGNIRPFENFQTVRKEKWRSQYIRLWVSYAFNGTNKINKRKNQSKNDARRRL
ncbi:MAG: TonB-dependent receptor [Saprospiraceae bacterium]